MAPIYDIRSNLESDNQENDCKGEDLAGTVSEEKSSEKLCEEPIVESNKQENDGKADETVSEEKEIENLREELLALPQSDISQELNNFTSDSEFCAFGDLTIPTEFKTTNGEKSFEIQSNVQQPSISPSLCEPTENKFNHNSISALTRPKSFDLWNPGMTLRKAGKFCDSTGTQFIKAKTPTMANIKTLNFSAQLFHEGTEIVLHNKGCLMMVDNDLVAEVEIQQPNLLLGAKNYQAALSILFRQLRIVRILLDDRLTKVEILRNTLLSGLEDVLNQMTVNDVGKIAYVQLARVTEKLSKFGIPHNSRVCQEIVGCYVLSEDLRKKAVACDVEERRVSKKGTTFQKLGLRQEHDYQFLYRTLRNLLEESVKRHKDALREIAPDHLRELLSNVPEEILILIRTMDVKLFADMASILDEEIFLEPLKHLHLRWINQLSLIQVGRLNRVFATTNKIYFFLCKSLEELIIQISEQTGIFEFDLLRSNVYGWNPINIIPWKEENLSTKALERQYYFLFRLLKHFEVGTNCNRKPFKYKTQLLSGSEMSSGTQSRIGNIIDWTMGFLGYSDSHASDIPEELRVWYCLLDDTLAHVLPQDCDLNVIESTLQSYLKLIRETKQDQVEVLRVATHNTIQFIVQVVPYMSSSQDGASIDQSILQKQFSITSFKEMSNASNYRDLVNVFSRYWKFRSEVITEIVSKMPLPEMDLLKQQLLNVVLLALGKCVENERLLAFFRTYEEFLIDLNEVPFDWYVKRIPGVEMQGVISLKKVEVLDNKWKDTVNETFRVVDPENFGALCTLLGMGVVEPRHYVIDILRMLLSYVTSQLDRKSWATNECLSTADQLSTTCELISAIHQSLLYLREQADYVSFELFYDESVKPFTSLVENSTSRQDFSTRVHLLKESFWFIRKQNEVDVETVLQLYEQINPNFDSEVLKEPYREYSKHFDNFMQISVGRDCSTAVALVAKEIEGLVSKDMHFTTWDAHFKRHKVPQILAGLGTVWSILVSKDVSSTGKYLSPNCVQILCVLRLLSVDKPTQGIEKHLTQVLTGQGKSLVLALVAALLALTGHTINIGCYNKYLVEKDRDNFKAFYSSLGITDVNYGTLCSLTNKFISAQVDGKTIGLRDLVRDLLFKEKTSQSNKLVKPSFHNSILLVDEVDVFFSKNFYGNTYNAGSFIMISGLDKIQELIWHTVSNGYFDVEGITKKVWELVRSQSFLEMNDFHSFLASKKIYQILTRPNGLKYYNNQSLLDEHIKDMINAAINVLYLPVSKWSEFKLNSLGQITLKRNEEYETDWVWGYFNAFNYFRLKKNNFITQIDGEKNYGYLTIDCGSLSYAMLPMNYPLILGVSGTLTDLTDGEKQTIEHLYTIKQLSSMPSFYGASNLRFDKTIDFRNFSTKISWKSHIFSQASKIVSANRAILIFFDDDHELNAFRSEYGGQFDRLNELTENTGDKEKCITEAGIAKTITLATRGMGRGVDYKSSVLVEKSGGVHVMQTFFSMDVKEETQIKGRTARQENKGSYELVVCQEDLIRRELAAYGEVVTYDTLAVKRQLLSIENNESIKSSIEKNRCKHDATMNYMKSFFKS